MSNQLKLKETRTKAKKQNVKKLNVTLDLKDILKNYLACNDQEVLICFKDKKTKAIKQMSTDPTNFSIDTIAKSGNTKIDNVQKFLVDQLVDLVQQSLDKADKKVISNIDTRECSDHESKDMNDIPQTNNTSCKFSKKIIPYKRPDDVSTQDKPSNLNIRIQKTKSEFHNLNGIDLASQLSEDLHQNTQDDFCLQPPTLNKAVLSIQNVGEFKEDNQNEQILPCESKYNPYTNNFNADQLCPLGLRKDFGRDDFAQKHLFRNGFQNSNNLEDEEEDDEDFSDNQDESYSSDEESILEADLTENSYTQNGISDESLQTTNRAFEFSESLDIQGSFNQASSYLKSNNIASGQENHDFMFMACSDWEAAIQAERSGNPNQIYELLQNCSDGNGQLDEQKRSNILKSAQHACQLQKQSKWKTKTSNKTEIDTSNTNTDAIDVKTKEYFDIDSIMKRNISPMEQQKLIHAQRLIQRNKKRSSSKKRHQKNEEQEHVNKLRLNLKDLDQIDSQQDLKRQKCCLSPLVDRSINII